ncbi:MAG TPA: hypothetical protein VKV05_08810 [Terriglobales bacterium]|nr:hypothetical protein [Terriglobales bacterium]
MSRQRVIHAAARFLWHDQEGGLRLGEGSTRELSRQGAYIMAEQCPDPGSAVQVLIDFGSDRGFGEGRLMAKGITVRADLKNGKVTGFAASLQFQRWREVFPEDDKVGAQEIMPPALAPLETAANGLAMPTV